MCHFKYRASNLLLIYYFW